MLKRLFNTLPWLIAVGLVIWLLRAVPLQATWTALRQLTIGALLVLVVMNGLVLLALNGRWWIILWGLDYRLPFWQLLGHRLAAFGVSYFTPGTQFGGEPVQVLLVEREHKVPRSTAVAAVTLDKTLELLVNFAFLAAGITAVLQSRLFGSRLGAELMWPALGLVALPGLLWIAIWRGWTPISRVVGWLISWSVWEKRPSRQQTLNRVASGIQSSEVEAARLFQNAPLTLWAAFAISIVGWLLLIAEYWLMLTYLGIDLTPLQAVALLTAARIAILMPLPGGLGTLEASQVFALSAMGQNGSVGLSISVLIRARDVLLGLFGLWWGVRRLNLLSRRTKMNPSPADGVFISTMAAHDEAGL